MWLRGVSIAWWAGALGLVGAGGCAHERPEPPYEGCGVIHNIFCDCPSPFADPAGPVHGIRSDGRVDVSARQAWPSRPQETRQFPTPAEAAEACAAFAACGRPPRAPFDWFDGATGFSNCLNGALGIVEVNSADRVIPLTGTGNIPTYEQGWPELVQRVLASAGDCDAVRSVLTTSGAPIVCQEDGCWLASKGAATVTCDGEVAHIRVDGAEFERDCARANVRCSEQSATGCTDRPLVRCDSHALDRCEGDIKLGCDDCGLVSFHDCSWNGGHCKETAAGAECVGPNDSSCATVTNACEGNSFSACVEGQSVRVDCAALGGLECRLDTPVSSRCPGSADGDALCPGMPMPVCARSGADADGAAASADAGAPK